jgi:hypothetical protein
MDRKHTSGGKGSRSTAGPARILRLARGRDSVYLGRVYTLAVILTILVAVATALIAPSIDMPDSVLREHHVTLHAAGAHTANNLSSTGSAIFNEAIQSDTAIHGSETSPSSNIERTQSSFVLRC